MAKRQIRVLSARCAFFAYLLLLSMLLPVGGYAQSTFGGHSRDYSRSGRPGPTASFGHAPQS